MRARSSSSSASASDSSSSAGSTPVSAASASRACASQASMTRSYVSGLCGSEPLTREGGHPVGERVQAEIANVGRRLCPGWCLICEGREGGRGVESRHSPVHAQFLRLRLESSLLEHLLQRSVLGEEVGGGLRAHALGARQAVGRVAAKRDEVRHLLRLDLVLLAYLCWSDPGELADSPDRLQDGRVLAGELERVAVGGGDEGGAAPLLLLRDRRSEEVVGLVAGALGSNEAEGPD